MNSNSSIFLAILMFLSISPLGFAEQSGAKKPEAREIVWGFSVYSPFKFKEGNEYRGIDVLLVQEIARQLNLKVKYVDCPFKRCLSLIKAGDIDIMTALGLRKEREEFVEFVQPPYNDDNWKAFYVRKNGDVKIEKFEDLYKYRIGVKTGVRYFPRFDEDKKIRKEEVYEVEHNLKKLAAGRIDAALNTQIQMDYLIIKNGYEGKFRRAKFAGDPGKDFIGISKKSPFAKDAPAFGRIIKELRDSGRMAKIVEQFFDIVRKRSRVVTK